MRRLARIVSLRIGQPRSYGDWVSAIGKEAVDRPLMLGAEGFECDAVADRKNHGGTEKALLAGASEHLPFYRDALQLPDLPPGAFGENLVLEGATEADVCIGDVVEVGGAVIELSQPRKPCWKQARRWDRPELPGLMEQSGRTGWYYRVLREGEVAPGDELLLRERPWPAWTVAACNELVYRRRDGDDAARLLGVPQLADAWRLHVARLLG